MNKLSKPIFTFSLQCQVRRIRVLHQAPELREPGHVREVARPSILVQAGGRPGVL